MVGSIQRDYICTNHSLGIVEFVFVVYNLLETNENT